MSRKASKQKQEPVQEPEATVTEETMEEVDLDSVGEDAEDLEEEAGALEPEEVLVSAAKLTAAETERDEFKDQLLRARAEFDNFRKRIARESELLRKTAAQALVRDLLPVVDNLERALDHIEDKDHPLALGMDMVRKQFENVLADHGVQAIPALGVTFDPNLHEALSHQPSAEFAADTVAVEYQRGYTMAGQVLRPARVVVSSGPPVPTEAADNLEPECNS